MNLNKAKNILPVCEGIGWTVVLSMVLLVGLTRTSLAQSPPSSLSNFPPHLLGSSLWTGRFYDHLRGVTEWWPHYWYLWVCFAVLSFIPFFFGGFWISLRVKESSWIYALIAGSVTVVLLLCISSFEV